MLQLLSLIILKISSQKLNNTGIYLTFSLAAMANTSCLNEGRGIFRHHLLLCRILQHSFKDCPLRGHIVIRCIRASSVLLMLTVYSVNNSINSYKTLLHPAWPSKYSPESKNCLGNILQEGVCLVPLETISLNKVTTSGSSLWSCVKDPKGLRVDR